MLVAIAVGLLLALLGAPLATWATGSPRAAASCGPISKVWGASSDVPRNVKLRVQFPRGVVQLVDPLGQVVPASVASSKGAADIAVISPHALLAGNVTYVLRDAEGTLGEVRTNNFVDRVAPRIEGLVQPVATSLTTHCPGSCLTYFSVSAIDDRTPSESLVFEVEVVSVGAFLAPPLAPVPTTEAVWSANPTPALGLALGTNGCAPTRFACHVDPTFADVLAHEATVVAIDAAGNRSPPVPLSFAGLPLPQRGPTEPAETQPAASPLASTFSSSAPLPSTPRWVAFAAITAIALFVLLALRLAPRG